MKKIKSFVLVLHLVFAVEILGAWNLAPETEEAFAEKESLVPQKIVEENEAALHEMAAKEEYAEMRIVEKEKSNEYYVVLNQNGQEEFERIQEEKRNGVCDIGQDRKGKGAGKNVRYWKRLWRQKPATRI